MTDKEDIAHKALKTLARLTEEARVRADIEAREKALAHAGKRLHEVYMGFARSPEALVRLARGDQETMEDFAGVLAEIRDEVPNLSDDTFGRCCHEAAEVAKQYMLDVAEDERRTCIRDQDLS